MSAGEESG